MHLDENALGIFENRKMRASQNHGAAEWSNRGMEYV